MSISRYLLTLVAAALVASSVYFILRDLPSLIATFGVGDPQLLAGEISTALMDIVLGLVGMIALGYLVWRVVSWMYLRPAERPKSLLAYTSAGMLTHLILYGGFAILYAFGSEGFDQSNLLLNIFATIIAGAAWGSIFWRMDPRARAQQSDIGEVFSD